MNDNLSVIQVEHLRKTYRDTVAVDDLSFTVQRGEIFGIVGPNGAGKTTTMECLAGLRRADRGSLRVLGLDPLRQGRELRRRVGVQLQQAALPDDLKVWEALDLFATFYDHPVDWRTLLVTWGLEEKRGARFASLSGGQKQRLFIALSLVNDPELVFLDEITTGLDPQARHNTWELVEKLREQGKTVVLVTHYMDEAERLCDRVAIIDHGQLVALDSPRQLIAGLRAETRVVFSAGKRDDYSWLRGVAGVSDVARQNGSVVVTGSGPLLARVVSLLAERDIVPADLRSEQATLEDVFLALTGRADSRLNFSYGFGLGSFAPQSEPMHNKDRGTNEFYFETYLRGSKTLPAQLHRGLLHPGFSAADALSVRRDVRQPAVRRSSAGTVRWTSPCPVTSPR